MDSNNIYNTLLPHCKPGFEKTLRVYIRFCVEQSHQPKTPDCDKHHILPSSLFPEYKNFTHNPWNRSSLTYRDHFRAHKMLARCIGGKMSSALWFMTNSRWSDGYQISLREYEQSRKLSSKESSEMQKERYKDPEEKRKTSEAMLKRFSSYEEREKLSISQKERFNNNPELYQEYSEKAKEQWKDPAKREKLSASCKEKYKDPEERRKTGEASKRMWANTEYRNKHCKPRTDETKSKISETLKNKPTAVCQYCGKIGKEYQLRKHHFENCKYKS